MSELRDAFTAFDKGNSGYIMCDDVNDILKMMGYNPKDKQLQKVTEDTDKDFNGRIDFLELVGLIDKLETDERKEGKIIIVSSIKYSILR